MEYHLAQVNIARMLAPIDSPQMADFVALLDEINALADQSAGFVWRFQGDDGNATYLRPYDDDRILFNMSVWESIESLRVYAYETAHGAVLRRRRSWFERLAEPTTALWWIRAGTIPTVGDATRRLSYLQTHGPTVFAFTFKQPFANSDEGVELPDEPRVRPCGAN